MLAVMHLAGWEIWVAAALLLAGGELLHGSLVLLAMAVACLPAALTSAVGGGPVAQILVFAVGLMAQYPLLARIAQRRRARRLATNAEAILGKRVRVLQPVSERAEGVVLLTGEHWKARSLAGDLPPGSEAQVVQRDGLCLLIIPVERELT